MAMKKACGCMTTRLGTLVFLYLFLINKLWAIISSFTDSENPVFKEFLRNNATICYASIFIAVIGCLIYLATILSISNDTPSISLLNSSIVFLLLSTIFGICITFYFALNGEFEEWCNSLIKKELQKYPSLELEYQEKIRTQMKDVIKIALKFMYFAVAIDSLIAIYAALVFHGYKTALKEDPVGASASRNVNDKEANFTNPPKYNLQFTAPQYSQPPQYLS